MNHQSDRGLMRSKALIVTGLTALVASTAASATPCPKPGNARPPHTVTPCTKAMEKAYKCKTHPPSTTPPVVSGPPRGTVPPIQAVPPLNANEPREAFCVQTRERGETFVQAGPNSFKPGGSWYTLWQTQATVSLDGHTVTLMLEDGLNGRQKGVGDGVILAANVPGVGLTCAQPYVSADGVYLHAEYGNR